MKLVNKSFARLLAVVGYWISLKNWFYMIVVPAIPGQTWTFGIMIGTHGRRGLLLGRKWVLNGMAPKA